MPIAEIYRRKVELLVRIIPLLEPETEFALKGGTAINLFIRDMPRLSVDIDLTYLPVADRAHSLSRIDAGMKRLAASIEQQIAGSVVDAAVLRPEGIAHRLIVTMAGTQVKIEVTPVLRGCVRDPARLSVSESVEDEFGFAEARVVSFDDLFAGKLVAALDRQHPRDLFDVRGLLANEGLDDGLRSAFLVYLISHGRPAIELLRPTRKDIDATFRDHFEGMTRDPVRLEDLLETREAMIEAMVGRMSEHHRNFLVGFERGDPRWSDIGIEGVEELPAVRWKLQNLGSLPTERRHGQADALAQVLGVR